jgi:transcriptional regulator with XRE-family HTH domain
MAKSKELMLSEEYRRILGRCLRELREYAFGKKTQEQVAKDDLGVSQSTLCEYETGRREPSLGFIHRAARAYGVHPNVILGVIHMREFPIEATLDGEAASVFDISQAMKPEQLKEVRDLMQRLGYVSLGQGG